MISSLYKIPVKTTTLFFQKKVVVLFFLLLSLTGFAQKQTKSNPGFIGKHIIITGEGFFSGNYFQYEKFWLKYGATSEFIINQGMSLGVSYLYNKTTVTGFKHSDAVYNFTDFSLNTQQFGLDLYLYPSQLAPLGFFYRFQAAYLMNTSYDFFKNGTLIPGKDPYSYRGYTNDEVSINNLSVSAFFGVKRVFLNTLVVSYGFQIGLTVLNPLSVEISNFDSFEEPSSNSDIFKGAVAKENFYSTFIAFKINAGIIW